jgi:hypothetical protein
MANSLTAEWQNGRMAEWQNGRIAGLLDWLRIQILPFCNSAILQFA